MAESYFNEHLKQVFGAEAVFIKFELTESRRNVSIDELPYTFAVGRLTYRESPTTSQSTQTLLVKHYAPPEAQSEFPQGYVPFTREQHFFQTVLPILDKIAPTQLPFAKYYVSCAVASPVSCQNVMIFEWRPENVAFEKVPPTFDHQHCLLMLKQIAQFHATSLLMKEQQSDLYNKSIEACPSQKFDSRLVLPFLRNCLQPLQQDSQFSQSVDSIDLILDNFEARLAVPFSSTKTDESCWVLCHQNYGQESVIFEQNEVKELSGLKIVNCQSMGFASLAVDLVIPLFVELRGANMGEVIDKLLEEYVNQLKEYVDQLKSSNVDCPDKSCILDEIRNSIPYALYVLASRVLRAQSDSQPQNSLFTPTWWTDSLITDLYKFLISAKYV